ncbi:DNA glycosylase AlkZ-like family protein [Virgibacillus doumboii]|uniref:DNA glycosylase AlkZ-like family protein n=1 Tax=Virgibacillus doumboii TaxID=2697503 RepID=UPI0013DEFC16|nr:crosslink repair DNA glycosylase YcaQ family protein [Virgibacillus doumboii]
MENLDKQTILHERMKKQGLLDPLEDPADVDGYKNLFKRLQPVAPVHNSRPGDPPKLVHRTIFDDALVTSKLRQKHQIVKARFQGGRVGYVFEEDLKLFTRVFQKPLKRLDPIHEEILGTIRSLGGISKDQLKKELRYSAKEITKALTKLQEAYLVYEDQIDTDWDTGWFDFSEEWFEVPEQTDESVEKILLQFLDSMVFANLDQIKSWSQLRKNLLKRILHQLVARNLIVEVSAEGLGTGYMKADPMGFVQRKVPKSVFMLDKSDILVRSHLDELKSIYKGQEVLQYLLIDGEFQGAVLGHWRIGPHDIDDVTLSLKPEQATIRKDEIIKAIRKYYTPERTKILKFNGDTIV